MGMHDRPYWQDEQQTDGGAGGRFVRGVTVGMPAPGRVVKYLLIINGAVFLLQLAMGAAGVDLSDYLGASLGGWWQPWRYLTFQFLHTPSDLFHIALNMLGLYMLGTPLERQWGGKEFLRFYLACGAVAGVAYVLMAAALDLPPSIPLIGASGGVYAIVLACAVLFPHFRLIFILFPVPIRLAAVIIFGGMLLLILTSLSQGQTTPRFWSDVAHLGGAVAAAVWIWLLPAGRRKLETVREDRGRGAWQRKMEAARRDQQEIDRILDKIARQGLASLSGRERKLLRDATRRQQQEEAKAHKL